MPEFVLGAALIAACSLALVLRRCVWLARVASWSMYPTLRPGAVVFGVAIPPDQLRRGDVVVLHRPQTPERWLVKRIIGLPGERVVVTEANVIVNGIVIDEPYVALSGGPQGEYEVPDRSYFLLGDNRRDSRDSRSWDDPYAPFEQVRGKVRLPPKRPATWPVA